MLSHNLFSAVIPLNKNNYCQARSKPRQPRDVHFLPVLFLPVRWFEATQKGTMISSKAWPSHPKSYKYLSLVILTARTRRCRKYMLVYKSMLYIYIYVYIYIYICVNMFFMFGEQWVTETTSIYTFYHGPSTQKLSRWNMKHWGRFLLHNIHHDFNERCWFW